MQTPPYKTKLTERPYFYELLLTGIVFLFLTIMSRTSSFINLSSGYDEAIFKIFGMAIAKGRVPYLDYIDRKGPNLFFINAIPYITHTYRFGLFLIQFVCQYITAVLTFRAITTFTTKKRALIALLGMYFFYSIFYGEGGQCEEYSLLFITLSLYVCFSFIRQKRPAAEHPLRYTFVYGVCFGIIAFIRVNDTATICGIVLAFAYLLIKEKQFLLLGKHIGIFICGMVFAALPVILYYAAHHALQDMIYWTFIEGFSYNNAKPFADYVKSYTSRIIQLMPTFIIVYLAKKYDRAQQTYYFPAALLIATLLYFTIGLNNFDHYFSVTMSFYAGALAYLLCTKNGIAICLLVFHFFPPKYHNGFASRGGFLLVAEQAVEELGSFPQLLTFNEQVKAMYRSVPESERENIVAYNISHGMGFYTINNVLPPNRAFVWGANYEDEFDDMPSPQYVLYQTAKDWVDDGAPFIEGYHEVSRVNALNHPDHRFMLHLLKKD